MMFRTHFSTWSPLIAQIRSSFSQSSQLCSRLSVVSETVFVQWVLTVNKNQRLTCLKYLQRVEFKEKFLWRESGNRYKTKIFMKVSIRRSWPPSPGIICDRPIQRFDFFSCNFLFSPSGYWLAVKQIYKKCISLQYSRAGWDISQPSLQWDDGAHHLCCQKFERFSCAECSQ